MDNSAGATSTVAKERYSKCADMSELRSQYIVEAPSPVPLGDRKTRTRADVRRAYAAAALDRVADTSGGRSLETEEHPPLPSSPSAVSPGATAEMNYGLKEDEAVSMAQTERIVQRMRNKK
jgi:hypothetical protein